MHACIRVTRKQRIITEEGGSGRVCRKKEVPVHLSCLPGRTAIPHPSAFFFSIEVKDAPTGKIDTFRHDSSSSASARRHLTSVKASGNLQLQSSSFGNPFLFAAIAWTRFLCLALDCCNARVSCSLWWSGIAPARREGTARSKARQAAGESRGLALSLADGPRGGGGGTPTSSKGQTKEVLLFFCGLGARAFLSSEVSLFRLASVFTSFC